MCALLVASRTSRVSGGPPHGVEPALRLYVEILGQAATQTAPFSAAAQRVAHRWLDWAQDRIHVPVDQRQDAAAALLATLDGLLILRLAVSSEAADRAVRQLLPAGACRQEPTQATRRCEIGG